MGLELNGTFDATNSYAIFASSSFEAELFSTQAAQLIGDDPRVLGLPRLCGKAGVSNIDSMLA